MSMKIFSLLFPFYQLHNSTQEINKKIEKLMKSPETYNFEYAPINPAIKKDVLKETLNSVLSNKQELENKAKSSLIAITISSALIFSIVQLLQNTENQPIAIMIALTIISSLSLLYMVIAGILSLYTLSEINKVCFPFPEDGLLDNKDQKEGLAQDIEGNYLYNMKRNNYMNTSYKCIVVSITLLVVIFLISSISIIFNRINDDNAINALNGKVTTIEEQTKDSIITVEKRLNALENHLINVDNENSIQNDKYNSIKIEVDALREGINDLKKQMATNSGSIEVP